MKIIIVGPTGFIGTRLLTHCLLSTSIAQILVITRRPLPDEFGSQKLHQLVIPSPPDWRSLPSLASAVAGAGAVVWCAGGRPRNFPSEQEFHKVTFEYPIEFAHALAAAGSLDRERFRFVYLSSWGAGATGRRRRWVVVDRRNAAAKGKAEMALLKVAESNAAANWEFYGFRPGTVVDGEKLGKNAFGGFAGKRLAPKCEMGLLVKAMVDVALDGYGDDGLSVFFENRVIVLKGREVEEDERRLAAEMEEEQRIRRVLAEKEQWG